jgi:hypothetical protein
MSTAARIGWRLGVSGALSSSQTAQKQIQRSLELLLASCVDDPADFQTVTSLTVEHSVVASVDPAADLGTRGDLLAGVWIDGELLEGLPEVAHVAASLVLTVSLGSVLANLFEVSGGFGAEGWAAPHPP